MLDPYRVLNVPRDADVATIKAAYRTLAKSLHPDRNPGDARAERRFKEVTQAYQILCDPKKRARFDRGEIDAEGKPRAGFGFGGFNPGAGNGTGPFAGFESIFEKAFGGSFGFRRAAGGGYGAAGAHPSFDDLVRGRAQTARGGPRTRARGGDIRRRIEVDFLAAARGAKERVALPDGRTVDVDLPPGTTDGQVLRLKGQGRAGSVDGRPGDVLIEIGVRPHPRFTRKGDDIHIELPISLPEAVLGAKVPVPTIDGRVRLTVPPGSNSGQTLRLKGRGVARRGGDRGDQYVRLIVVLPERPDSQMAADLRRWAEGHGYDARRNLDAV